MTRFKRLFSTIYYPLTLRFLFYFLIILTIPMLGFGISYNYWIDMVRQEGHQKNLTSLQLISVNVSNNIAELNYISTQLGYDQDINHFLLMDNPENDTSLIADVLISSARLKSVFRSSQYVSEIYIYSYFNGMTIGKNMIEIKRDGFFDCWNQDDYTSEDLKKIMLDLKGNRFLVPQEFEVILNRRVVPYLIPLNVTYSRNYAEPTISVKAGVLIVMIDSGSLGNMLNSSGLEDLGGTLLILDSEGNVIADNMQNKPGSVASIQTLVDMLPSSLSVGGYYEMNFKNEKHLVTYIDAANGWRYVSIIPEAKVFEKINTLRITVWVLSIITLLVGTAIAYLLASKVAKPINQIVKDTGHELKGSFDSFSVIRNYLNNLQAENVSMGNLLESQNEMVNYSIYQRLLYGGFESEQEYLDTIENFGISPILGNIIPVLVCIGVTDLGLVYSNKDQLQFGKYLVKKELQDVFSVLFIADVNHNTIVFLYHFSEELNFESTISSFLENGMNELKNRLQKKYRMNIAAYGGFPSTSVMQISFAFRSAMHAMDHFSPKNGGITWFKPGSQNEIYYPEEQERLLISSIKSGDTTQAVGYLDTIYKENIFNRRLTIEQIDELCVKLRDTIGRIVKQIYPSDVPEEITTLINKADELTDIAILIDNQKTLVNGLSNEMEKRRKQSRKQIAESISELVNKNYADSSLSLTNLSEELGYSEQYISTVFHEVTGEHFSKYLERKRLNEACSILHNSTSSLEDIAFSTGYGSVNAFRRAFKRVYNITPGEYRTKGKN